MKMEPTQIAGLGAIADRFDHVLLDQWGTLHEGGQIFPAADDCVAHLRKAGKRVLVLSNSGKRADSNATRLGALGLPPDAYDGILTSGEVTWRGLKARREPFNKFGPTCFPIARGGDHSIVDGLDLTVVADMTSADFILLAGLDDSASEPEQWRESLTAAAARGVPMLCANPDLTMFGANGLISAPGALARFYDTLGGNVTFVGKPHAPIFIAALDRLGRPNPGRVLMIGDSLDHDVAGARAAGMLALLISSGVHRASLQSPSGDLRAIQSHAGARTWMPHWTMKHLSW
jgi:HAD superfamily hydrolase (TIGR01459 family)